MQKSIEMKQFILVGVFAQERLCACASKLYGFGLTCTFGQFIVQVVVVFINNKSILEMSIQIVVTPKDVLVYRTVT